jgi:hypothetical protein
VKVGSLPIVFRASGLTPRNRTDIGTTSIAAIRRCTTAGLRITAREFANTSKVLAMTKQLKEVIELDIRKSHSTMQRTAL